MIGVKTLWQLRATGFALASGQKSKNSSLTLVEKPLQRFSRYSVSMMSRIGRFAGGLSVACSLIRTIAVA